MIDIKECLYSIINQYVNESDTIVVLKGIDTGHVHEISDIYIDKVINNKMSYFMNLYNTRRKLILYDEYLALYELIHMQYKRIIIIANNIYINYFPMQIKISEERMASLRDHFDDEKEGDKYEIGDILPLTSIYGDVKYVKDQYYVSYNNIISDEKETIIPLFSKSEERLEKEEKEDSDNCYEILDEESYLIMLNNIFEENKRNIYVIEKNTFFNSILVEEKLRVLKYVLQNDVEIKILQLAEGPREVPIRPEFLDILKRYWGHKSFRKIKVYNTNKLNNREKSIYEISQHDIVTNIVEETEKCINKLDYRDIFVTAPTGAGKSAIFQIPAIYLADKYQLFTIVISPLIGLMKDQVKNLELRNYTYSRTINSDISPIQKQEIINDIADGKCNILYISPESLLSKSDLEQIIGDRTLGLLVIDEAHIVTTWGKQFRPDYWYLGDHLNKMKKSQLKKKGMGFVIATFTATAIYGGIENMYEETIESLKMVDPITYLGYIKREDILINVNKKKAIKGKTEYELNKFDYLIDKIDLALMENKKMLIYFPTVALINRFWDYCIIKGLNKYISKYHGRMTAYEKEENYLKFLNNENNIMIATKAFGMGIDIEDIEIVAHFAPTGNVCDYVQEIGRAARLPNLTGEAYYDFMSNDFKHINRLHGLSVVKEYQLVEVIRKVYELYQDNIKNNSQKKMTKKRNEMLVDAESFAHIFENPFFNEDDGINKVKTAMLLIQKDFERTFSFAPFHVRPIPLFEIGFFRINTTTQMNMRKKYGNILKEVDSSMQICTVNLKNIWEVSYSNKYSFPKFKYMIYSKDSELDFEFKNDMAPALCINIDFEDNWLQIYDKYMTAIKTIVNRSIREEKFYEINGDDALVQEVMKALKINIYKAKSIVDTVISAMNVYQRDYSKSINSKVFVPKPLKSGDVKYKFTNGATGFFRWIENSHKSILENLKDGVVYLVDEQGNKGFKESLLILGILETFGLLVFKALGGSNSQIYIYVNQTKTMKEIIDKPWRYRNRLLELIGERHKISVEMLTFLFEENYSSDEIWDYIEGYFLGIIPEEVIKNYENKNGKELEVV